MRLRVGRHLGRTLYIQPSDDPTREDVCIGMVDTAGIAELIVRTVNERYTSQELEEALFGPDFVAEVLERESGDWPGER